MAQYSTRRFHSHSTHSALTWCLQGVDESAVIFAFSDPSLYAVALSRRHRIAGNPVSLAPMKNGRVTVTLKRK